MGGDRHPETVDAMDEDDDAPEPPLPSRGRNDMPNGTT